MEFMTLIYYLIIVITVFLAVYLVVDRVCRSVEYKIKMETSRDVFNNNKNVEGIEGIKVNWKNDGTN